MHALDKELPQLSWKQPLNVAVHQARHWLQSLMPSGAGHAAYYTAAVTVVWSHQSS